MKHNYEDYKKIRQYCADKGIRFIATEGLFPHLSMDLLSQESMRCHMISYIRQYAILTAFDMVHSIQKIKVIMKIFVVNLIIHYLSVQREVFILVIFGLKKLATYILIL